MLHDEKLNRDVFPCCVTSDSDLNAGESYVDCVRRLTPIILEMEEHHNLVVVAHQAVLRCIFGYLLRRPLEDIPYIKIPQHAIMQVRQALTSLFRFFLLSICYVIHYDCSEEAPPIIVLSPRRNT